MYQMRGLGALWGPSYALGFDGKTIVDCSGVAEFFTPNCLNPFAKRYSMLDYTTQADLGPTASPATQAAVAADTQATIQQQCADDPADCAVASADYPDAAALSAGAAQAAIDAASAAANFTGDLASNLMPGWAWAALIGGGALVALIALRR